MTKFALLLSLPMAYALYEDSKGPSISTTNTCLPLLGGVSFFCTPVDGTIDYTLCCPALVNFNSAICYCNPLTAGRAQALKNALQVCNAAVIEPPNCPSSNSGFNCPVDANTLDALRYQTLQTFSATLGFDDGKTPEETQLVYNELFTPDSVWALVGTGEYVGPSAIFEYARIVDPALNSQMGDQFQVNTVPDAATTRFYVDAITYNTNSKFCFGETPGSVAIEEGGTNCVNYFETAGYYEVVFPPCSAQISYMYTEAADEALVGFVNSRGTLYQTCERIQDNCQGEYRVYNSTKDCFDYLSQRPITACEDLMIMGPSQSCAWLHAGLTPSDKNHCFHTGKQVADLDGKYKCNPDQCVHGFTAEYRASKGLCPDVGDCCTSTAARCGKPEDAPGAIAACVGAFDAYCLTTGWDSQCRNEAIEECGLVC